MSEKFKTSIDLPADVCDAMITLLNQQVADTFDLFSQVKQVHWNVKGMHFHQLHEFYDELAGELPEFVDMIAERATALGGTALGTARMSANASRLPECPVKIGGSRKSVEILVERYAHIAKTTRAAIDAADKAGDKDTADLFTELSRAFDKNLWLLEAHLQE